MSDDQRDLLQRFVEAINGGQVPLEEDMQAVSALLAEVLAGGTLKLSKPRGAPAGRNDWREHKAVESVLAGDKKIQDLPCDRATYYRWKKKHGDLVGSVLAVVAQGKKIEAAKAAIIRELAGHELAIRAVESFTNQQILEFAKLVRDAGPTMLNDYIRNLEEFSQSQ